nr:MAG TPA: hypothetical protein [Caudoviricetes sp.]
MRVPCLCGLRFSQRLTDSPSLFRDNVSVRIHICKLTQ